MRKSLKDKESWQLEINEHVVCMMDCHCNEGVCLGAIPNQQDPPDSGEGKGKYRKLFADGTLIEYNQNTGKMKVDVKGDLDAIVQAKATVTAPNIELAGAVKITGACIVTGALSAASIATTGGGTITSAGNMNVVGTIQASGDVLAGTKSLSSHTHIAPSGGGVTSTPN